MRITSNQLANIVRRSVADNTERLYKAQETVSTEKLVNRPSDDPLAMGRILDYRTTLASIDQYVRNIEQAKLQIEFSEKQVEEVHNQLQMAKNMAIDQSDGDADLGQQTAEDIQHIYDRLLDIANTKLGNNYIFAGHQNGTQPVDCAEVDCEAGISVTDGDYFMIGNNHYVWYDKNGDHLGDPGFNGMTGIEVAASDLDSAIDVAANTKSAIDTIADFACVSDSVYPERIVIEYNSNPKVTCQAAAELSGGEYFTLGSDYYVWYDKTGDGITDIPTESSLSGKTAIRVDISGGGDANTVANATKSAIDTVLDAHGGKIFSTAVNLNEIDITWEPNSVPDLFEGSSEFNMRSKKYEETPPFTACSEVSLCPAGDLSDGDYFTLGPDYYVWYHDTDGGGSDPIDTVSALSGKFGIKVDFDASLKASDIAAKTAEAIDSYEAPPGAPDSGKIFDSGVTEDDETRIEITFADGSPPDIAKQVETGFTLHTVKYNGDNGDLNFAVSKTLKIKGNATGNEIFIGEGLGDGVNIFDTLKALKDALEAPAYNSDWISSIKDDLIKGLDQVEDGAVDLSVAYTRLESTEKYWDRFKLAVQDMLSENEDANLAQAIVELQHQETVYEATLAASAKLFNQSLIDFLR